MALNDKPDWLRPSFSLFGLTLTYAPENSSTRASWTREPEEDTYLEYSTLEGTQGEAIIMSDNQGGVWWLNKIGLLWVFDAGLSQGGANAGNVPDWSDALWSLEIKRRIELYLVSELKAAIPSFTAAPGHVFVPFTGGDEIGGAIEIEPPFTVVAISDATRAMATEGTWTCVGKVQVITHSKETSSPDHSALSRAIYFALSNIPPYIDKKFVFHGIDVGDTTSADDEASQAHADIISFACGASG